VTSQVIFSVVNFFDKTNEKMPFLRGFIGGKCDFKAILRYKGTKNERFRRKNERVWSKNG
jgi:hypothetical protein